MERLIIVVVIGAIGALIGAAFGVQSEANGYVFTMIGGVMGTVVGAHLAKLL